jgi:hypothetical protein
MVDCETIPGAIDEVTKQVCGLTEFADCYSVDTEWLTSRMIHWASSKSRISLVRLTNVATTQCRWNDPLELGLENGLLPSRQSMPCFSHCRHGKQERGSPMRGVPNQYVSLPSSMAWSGVGNVPLACGESRLSTITERIQDRQTSPDWLRPRLRAVMIPA